MGGYEIVWFGFGVIILDGFETFYEGDEAFMKI